MTNIVQIVPRLPPAISGVGDYAMLLAKELQASHSINTRFLVSSKNDAQKRPDRGFRIAYLLNRKSKSLRQQLEADDAGHDPVILHYVGYGYQKRGGPLWLLRGLQEWKKESARRLITIFHELFAMGAPWQSSFWLSPLQRHIASGLAKLSDVLVTNRYDYARILEKRSPRSVPPTVLPVMSNVGEPLQVENYADREPWLVVFGSDQSVREAFTFHAEAISEICDRLKLGRIKQIGSSAEHRAMFGRPVDVMGVLPAGQVSNILSKSKAGFLNYGSGCLAKSGVFAAYCAHGVVPIFPLPNESRADKIFQGTHYLLASDLQSTDLSARLSMVSQKSREWYANHSRRATATVIARFVSSGDV